MLLDGPFLLVGDRHRDGCRPIYGDQRKSEGLPGEGEAAEDERGCGGFEQSAFHVANLPSPARGKCHGMITAVPDPVGPYATPRF